MEVAIVTSGYLPVPAALGGAVEALIDHLILKNEEYKKINLVIFSAYHKKSVKMTGDIKESKFVFIKAPIVVRLCDRMVYFFAKKILKKEKSMSYRYIVQRLHYINKVSKYLQMNNFDKVILENHPTLFLTLKRRHNAEKYAGRYYYHLHNEVTNDYGCRKIMLHCTKVLGVSKYIDYNLENFLGCFPQERMDILRNCVDTTRFGSLSSKQQAEQMRRKYGINTDEKIILFTGRLSKEKGIKELMLAFKKADLPKTKLVIAGGYFYASGMVSDYEKELQEIAKPIQSKIVFTGFIDYKDMPALYSMADLAVIPSMWEDPAPLTVIETMASGLPLITTVSGGIPEYANNDCSILLTRDQHFVNRLADALITVLSDHVLRQKMSVASRQTAEHMNLDCYYTDFVGKLS